MTAAAAEAAAAIPVSPRFTLSKERLSSPKVEAGLPFLAQMERQGLNSTSTRQDTA